jgi:hypothetical protein
LPVFNWKERILEILGNKNRELLECTDLLLEAQKILAKVSDQIGLDKTVRSPQTFHQEELSSSQVTVKNLSPIENQRDEQNDFENEVESEDQNENVDNEEYIKSSKAEDAAESSCKSKSERKKAPIAKPMPKKTKSKDDLIISKPKTATALVKKPKSHSKVSAKPESVTKKVEPLVALDNYSNDIPCLDFTADRDSLVYTKQPAHKPMAVKPKTVSAKKRALVLEDSSDDTQNEDAIKSSKVGPPIAAKKQKLKPKTVLPAKPRVSDRADPQTNSTRSGRSVSKPSEWWKA